MAVKKKTKASKTSSKTSKPVKKAPVAKAAPAKTAKAKPAKKQEAKKPAAPAKAVKAKPAPASKGPDKSKSVKAKTTAKAKTDDRRSAAKAALMEALEEEQENAEDEEFDPEAFFAASGGQGLFRAHVMRKERVDLNINVRFRTTGPLVQHAELINLSKDGLCLKTKEIFEEGAVLKVEIPLPHTSELFSIQVKVIWSQRMEPDADRDEKVGAIHTGTQFMPMSLAKQSVINTFIQQRRDEIIMAKIGLDKFSDSAPVAGID